MNVASSLLVEHAVRQLGPDVPKCSPRHISSLCANICTRILSQTQATRLPSQKACHGRTQEPGEEDKSRTFNVVKRGTPPSQQTLFRALIRFESQEEASRAVRERDGCFMLNLPVTVRVVP